MKNDDNIYLSCIGGIAYFVILMVVSTLINGWAFALLWEWFIVSAFGLPSITILQAIGISSVVSFLTADRSEKEQKDSDESITKRLVYATAICIAQPLFALLFGYIITLFMKG